MKTLDIAENLYTHYASIEEVKHYYGILAIYALLKIVEDKKSEVSLNRAKKILLRFPDEIDHPYYNFPSYKIGGVARAYALYRGILGGSQEQELIQFYAEDMLNQSQKNKSGVIVMPSNPPEDKTWIDVVTAVTPFMLFAGLALDTRKYVDFAIYQCLAMYDDLIDETGLLNQCRGFVGESIKSKDHWGRGNGWGYVGLIELLQHLPENHSQYFEVEKRFFALSNILLSYQSKEGAWRQEITDPKAYLESSATGLILYGFGVGIRLGKLNYEKFLPAFQKGIQHAIKSFINQDFSTNNSCPGCLCPGEGEEKGTIEAYISQKQPQKDEHHSFAPLMLALSEAYNQGIVEISR